MNAVLHWFAEQSNILALLQIALDFVLIVFLGILFIKRPRHLTGREELTQSLEKIVDQTRALADQFDTNLQERRELIQQIIASLDQKAASARELCRKLDDLNRGFQTRPPTQSPNIRHSENQEILRLAQKGLDASAIAKELHKPVGEVELVLNLKRLSTEG